MEQQTSSELIPLAEPESEAVPEFDVVLRGYDRRQVDEYLDRLEADLAAAHTERATLGARSQALDKQLAEQDREVQAARRQLVETAQPTYAGLGARVHQLLSIAEQEAADIRAKAEAAAVQIRGQAEKDISHLRERADSILAEAKARAEAAERDHTTALDARRQRAEREDTERLTAAQRQASELTDKAQQRLAEADKRAEALSSSARSDADRLVREAEEHRAKLFATAKDDAEKNRAELMAEIAELQRRRDSAHAQLDQLRQALGGLPDATNTTPDNITPATQAQPQRRPDSSSGRSADLRDVRTGASSDRAVSPR